MKKKLHNSLTSKIVCFILLVIVTLTTISSICLAAFICDNDVKFSNKAEKENLFKNQAYSTIHIVADKIHMINYSNDNSNSYGGENPDYSSVDEYLTDKNIGLSVKNKYGKIVYSYNNTMKTDTIFNLETSVANWNDGDSSTYKFKVFIDTSFENFDKYYLSNLLWEISYKIQYLIFPICAILIILELLLLIYLINSAGHSNKDDDIHIDMLSKIPFDIFIGFYILIALFTFFAADNIPYRNEINIYMVSLISSAITLLIIFILYFILSVAVRIKSKTLLKNSISYRILKFPILMIKKIFLGIKRIISNIPILWKSAVIISLVSIIEITLVMNSYYDMVFAGIFLIFKIFISIIIIYIVLMMKKIEKGGKALANGELSYKIDDKLMFGNFKNHSKNLNEISGGLNKAVAERMKSERFKTELLTNVSHDIKTPLTSIINYTDLISKEETENEKIIEHCEVLLRQSTKLKTLIEDLVEASKASTGNLDVNLERCQVDVILNQATAEYEDTFSELGLNLIMNMPEEAINIMADGKHLWRIFDNLLCNIKKYSLENTRVYIDVKTSEDQKVEISFKNISKYALDISPDELIERFSRGDKSRKTEGHGLGLSIAYNLSDLQGGHMKISIDGDLFKATLKFKTV